eukprot:186262-Rhodomonas_salina.1
MPHVSPPSRETRLSAPPHTFPHISLGAHTLPELRACGPYFVPWWDQHQRMQTEQEQEQEHQDEEEQRESRSGCHVPAGVTAHECFGVAVHACAEGCARVHTPPYKYLA